MLFRIRVFDFQPPLASHLNRNKECEGLRREANLLTIDLSPYILLIHVDNSEILVRKKLDVV